MIELPRPAVIGEREIIKKYGKRIFFRDYEMPDGRTEDFLCLDAPGVVPVIGMPITKNGNVVLVRQFRYGVDEFIYEFPGGCPKPGQSTEDAFHMELSEEVGYGYEKLHTLRNPLPFEPASVGVKYVPLLATGCEYHRPPHRDRNEILEVIELPFETYLAEIKGGLAIDSKTAAITLFALFHLGHELTKISGLPRD